MAGMHGLANGTRVKRLAFPGTRCLNAPHLQGSIRCGSSGPQCSSNEAISYRMQKSFASVAPSHDIENTTERVVLSSSGVGFRSDVLDLRCVVVIDGSENLSKNLLRRE